MPLIILYQCVPHSLRTIHKAAECCSHPYSCSVLVLPTCSWCPRRKQDGERRLLYFSMSFSRGNDKPVHIRSSSSLKPKTYLSPSTAPSETINSPQGTHLSTMHTSATTSYTSVTPHGIISFRRQQQKHMPTAVFLSTPWTVALAFASISLYSQPPTRTAHDARITNNINQVSHHSPARVRRGMPSHIAALKLTCLPTLFYTRPTPCHLLLQRS